MEFLCGEVFVSVCMRVCWAQATDKLGGWQRRRMFVAGHNFVLERTKALPADGTSQPCQGSRLCYFPHCMLLCRGL